VNLDGRLPIGSESVQLEPVLHSNSTLMLYQAARAGLGVVILPSWLVQEDLQAGRLLELFPQYPRDSAKLYAICSSGRHRSARLQAFLQLLTQSFAES